MICDPGGSMRVGQSQFSAHQAGMSSLWHDVDYVPEQRFETPPVRHHGVEDMALPSEQHQLPEGVDDPFKRHGLDAIAEIAGQQMELGIKGTNFLHGKMPRLEEPSDPRRVVDSQVQGTRKGTAAEQKIVESIRTDLEQVRMTNQAAATTIPKTKGSTKTAAESEAVAAAPSMSGAGDVLGTAATFMPMAIGTGIQTAVQGPLPALASQAITVAGAVGSAVQVSLVGVAEATKEDAPVVVRRGLQKLKG